MTIDLATFANVFALIGCAALLVIWATIGRRKLSNFLICCVGGAAIVACVRSDHQASTMIGILICTALVSIVLGVGFTMLKARRAAHRQQLMVYRPKVSKTHQN